MARTGRPSSLSEDRYKIIVNMVSSGSSIKRACEAVGIHPSTYRKWRKKAKEGKQPFKDFFARMEAADAGCEAAHVQIVHKLAAAGNLGAATWMLSHKWPKRWAKQESLAVKAQGGGTKSVTVQVVYDSEVPAESAAEPGSSSPTK